MTTDYEAVVNNVYHFVWTEMNKIDADLEAPRDESDAARLIADREIYWKVLAHLDPAAAADRARSYGEREEFKLCYEE